MSGPAVVLRAGEQVWRFRFGNNALAELEGMLGLSLPQLGKRLAAGEAGFRELRALVWAGLLHEQPDITLRQAGEVMDAAGLEAAVDAAVRAFTAAFPPGEKGGKAGAMGEGKALAAGTGTASSGTPAGPA